MTAPDKPSGAKARLAALEAWVAKFEQHRAALRAELAGWEPTKLTVSVDARNSASSEDFAAQIIEATGRHARQAAESAANAATDAGKAPYSAETASDGAGQPETPEGAPEASTGEIQWGREIEVDGRPAWLRDDDMTTGRKRPFTPSGDWPDPALNWKRAADVEHWEHIRAIRLPADHPAYTALNAGFEPWRVGISLPVMIIIGVGIVTAALRLMAK